jgi:hypothetical protein
MGHRITGIIARDEVLHHLVSDPGRYVEGWTYLSDGLMSILAGLSHECDALYIETDYFGGIGGQAAIMFRAGKRFYGPRTGGTGPINESIDPISEALGLAGVVVSSVNVDAFAEAGLDRYRSNEDWKAAASVRPPASRYRPRFN